MNGQYFVYILECSDQSYYVGSTDDIVARLDRHNAGEAAEWTKNRRPVKIVCQEEYGSILEARRREEQIKGWTRQKKENLINRVWKKR